jgi:hypothetical protein
MRYEDGVVLMGRNDKETNNSFQLKNEFLSWKQGRRVIYLRPFS